MRVHSSIRFVLIAVLILAASAASFGQVFISVRFGPPAIPVYVQPLCPAEGYIWTPGYWAWDPDFGDYYWVPGTWVLAPQVGYLWTPGWWGWGGNAFLFHEGYWGPRIGFYGGINYGFGYFGNGYEGGRWDHDRFYYNRSVTNVNVTNITNVYNTTVINNNNTRVSYNGGQGGLEVRPTPEQVEAEHERHLDPLPVQRQHVQAARSHPELRATTNHGKPPIAATAKPGAFKEGAVPAKEAGAPYTRPASSIPKQPNGSHAKDLPPHEKPPAPNTGDPKLDAKYQKQQDKLYAKQEQDHQKLAQKQEQQHEQMLKQQANEQKQQQMEMKHQQQTQQMEAKHTQQQQHMQQRQAPPPNHGGEPNHH